MTFPVPHTAPAFQPQPVRVAQDVDRVTVTVERDDESGLYYAEVDAQVRKVNERTGEAELWATMSEASSPVQAAVGMRRRLRELGVTARVSVKFSRI